jgi:hypothetical protein
MIMIRIKSFSLLIFFLFIYAVQEGLAANQPTYLIITTNNHTTSPSLTKFINFRKTDFNVDLVTTDRIGSTADDFRNFIRSRQPYYVLLVGKYSDFPTYTVQYGEAKIQTYNTMLLHQ